MKILRTVLPLLLLSFTVLLLGRDAFAQTPLDSVYISVPTSISGSGGVEWRLSFNHSGSDLHPIGNILLSIDTTRYFNVRFDPNILSTDSPAAAQYQWTANISSNDAQVSWCNSVNQIQHTQKDSFFVFGLTANPNSPTAPYLDSPVTIQWVASFQSNNCTTFQTISTGSFVVIPVLWQNYYPLDTATATASVLPDCDPSFNFTMQNRNVYSESINKVVFRLFDANVATMRPSEMQAPPGWVLDSVTQLDATFETQNGIPSQNSLSGFIVGLRAKPSAVPYSIPFTWSAYNVNLGTSSILDRDTVWDTAVSLRVAPCSESVLPSSDTLTATNDRDCNFNFNLANSHSGEGNLTVSRITALNLQITTPGVTWGTSITPPEPCWYFSSSGNQTLSFHSTGQLNCSEAAGLTFTYKADINDPNPGEPVTVHWIDSSEGSAISSGNITIHCAAHETQDNVYVDALGGCQYDVRIKNTHNPVTSQLHSATFVMPATVGTFSTAPGTLYSNANWATSAGNGGVTFTASGGTGLAPGATDTFYFTADMKADTPWSMTVITKEGGAAGNTITDSVIGNIPGCTPPIILDSIVHNISPNCSDLITIFNHGATPIDSFIVAPVNGGAISSANIAIPWKYTIQGDSVIFYNNTIDPEASRAFTVTYGDISLPPIHVEVRTLHTNGGASTINDTNLECSAGVVTPQTGTAPLTLSIAPNPMKDQTNIVLTTGALSRVQLVLLNVLGQSVQVVEDRMLSAGEHQYTLDAGTLPAGSYYLRLEAEGQVMTKKLVIER